MSTQVKKFYNGFSTRGYEGFGKLFEIINVECIEEDLMNEIFTERGQRLMMPTYGTRIPLLVFEMNDQQTQDIVREDITTVISHDPRVRLMNLDILPAEDKNALVVIAKINYLEFNVTKDLWISVNSR